MINGKANNPLALLLAQDFRMCVDRRAKAFPCSTLSTRHNNGFPGNMDLRPVPKNLSTMQIRVERMSRVLELMAPRPQSRVAKFDERRQRKAKMDGTSKGGQYELLTCF